MVARASKQKGLNLILKEREEREAQKRERFALGAGVGALVEDKEERVCVKSIVKSP